MTDSMSLVKHFAYFLLLHLVIGSPQINLDLTDWPSDDSSLEHDCLHIAILNVQSNSRDMIPFCMSEWPSKWNIEINQLQSRFTFAELRKSNVTSEHLYRWSGPIDVIERYQLYLNILLISNQSLSMATELFYNCTSPWFGPQCQYSFDVDITDYSSLKEYIYEYYLQPYEPKTLTCYIHLQCNRGPFPTCLDWSEICDGKVDCEDGIDEKNCSQLMNNECKDDEYRCDNGQCILKTFFNDNLDSFECLDRSDQTGKSFMAAPFIPGQPTFANEDVICSWRDENMNHYSSEIPFTSSCVTHRNSLVRQAMFSDNSLDISHDCSLAVKCHLSIITSENQMMCSNFCKNGLCIEIIEQTCPQIFSIPSVPLLFGHIYFVYTNQYVIQRNESFIAPEYICYNEQLCSGFHSNKTVLSFKGSTCRRPEDFPVYFNNTEKLWHSRYIKPLYSQLMKCNTIRNDNPTVCNSINMYMCKNSSKCIPKSYIGDNYKDCDYGDDEEQTTIDNVCLTDRSNMFYRCRITNKCIHRNKVNNGICDCEVDEYGICDDEKSQINIMSGEIPFSIICDRFIDLLPVIVDGRTETDETECQYWPCNNTYTRCDGIWTCCNGADEINCDSSSLSKCPPNHHICVSPETNQLICLPIEKAGDGILDCLGGMDEPYLCPIIKHPYKQKQFYCSNDGSANCLSSMYLCDGIIDCKTGDDESFCNNTSDVKNFVLNYFGRPSSISSKSETSLTYKINQETNALIPRSSNIRQDEHLCQRGIPLRVRLNSEKNVSTITCLCPPSFYGDKCQYQNQRVSLTMQVHAPTDSVQIPFVLVVSLIDDSAQRIIHSYQQLTYLHTEDRQTKFNIYLLHSTRPKISTKQYSVHIDIYEKMTLRYRGSSLILLKFPFLPLERIAFKLDIPRANNPIETCSNNECIHGQCTRYLNDQKNISFCRCNPGWSGQYCNIPHMCTCSPDSLCVGIAANNRSLCVCPFGKFGSRCLLQNTVCESGLNKICLNGGQCLPADEHSVFSRTFLCICPKGFTGSRCEIPDTKIILSFHKDLVLSFSTPIFFHFIQFINNSITVRDGIWKLMCTNQNSTTVQRSRSFHIAFVEFPANQYYLIANQNVHNSSAVIARAINPLDRCRLINEIFNASIVRLPTIRRIKYYHVPCQNYSSNLSCFHDDTYMCVCNGDQRTANCFQYDFYVKPDDLEFESSGNETECSSEYSSTPFTSSTSSRNSGMSSGIASVLFITLFAFYTHYAQ